jgi:hypothetical protein
MSSAFGSNYPCGQIFSLMMSDKSNIRTRLIDGRLKGYMGMAAIENEPNTEIKPLGNIC